MRANSSSFRDHIPTITDDGKKRKWIYPKLIKGKLYQYRTFLSWFLLVLLFMAPFIHFRGEQLVLLNVLERKFVFFGVIFLPQDFHLFVLGMLSFMVFIVLFTVIFGRVWCGWACPQTIFMEMLFRKIEYWIEGNAQQQRRLDEQPLNLQKAVKKGLKHFIFIFLSFLIANTFLAYLIGSDTLIKIVSEPVHLHLTGFTAIWLFTAVFYLVFAKIRELVCTVICPYGRLQGVLLDKQSLLVAYDYQRGEPRGKIRKEQEQSLGDCVDCHLCVQVCPTGIDIRNGTQLECINCTACIDACDSVMTKLNRPRRLIGFKTEEQISLGIPFHLTKRFYAYSGVFGVLFSAFVVLLLIRRDVETNILRAGGTLYQLRDDGTISNLYNTEIVNKTHHTIHFVIEPDDPNVKIQFITQDNIIKKGEALKTTFFVICPQNSIKKYKTDISLKIMSENKEIDRATTTFIAPPKL